MYVSCYVYPSITATALESTIVSHNIMMQAGIRILHKSYHSKTIFWVFSTALCGNRVASCTHNCMLYYHSNHDDGIVEIVLQNTSNVSNYRWCVPQLSQDENMARDRDDTFSVVVLKTAIVRVLEVQHTYIHTYVCTYIRTYVCTYVRVYTYICTYVPLYICTYVHT